MRASDENTSLGRFGGLMIFIGIAALLWLVIKLSDDYAESVRFKVRFTDTPANLITTDKDYSVEATVTAQGFKLLNYHLRSFRLREITVSLKDMKYKILSDNRYSIGSTAMKEAIADVLEINAGDVEPTQTDYVFTMYRLASKRVKVNIMTDLSFRSQYNIYGEPTVTPDSITIYGAFNILKDYEHVNTQTITRKNVTDDIEESVGLQLDADINADIKKVDVVIDVEKFTESEVTIPINTLGISNMVIFPPQAKVKYIVSLDDYSNISQVSFNIEVDTTNFITKEFLPTRLVVYPNNTSIIGIYPDKVEYLITQ